MKETADQAVDASPSVEHVVVVPAHIPPHRPQPVASSFHRFAMAALAADGSSLIHGAHHVHRGYENIDRKFQQLGASIARTAEPSA